MIDPLLLPDLPGGWYRAPRSAAAEPLRRLSTETLATMTGPEAEKERAQRAKEEACEHEPRRVGRSTVMTCRKCGAVRAPEVR